MEADSGKGAVCGPQFHPQLSSAARSSGKGPGSPKGSALTPAHLRICFSKTLGPETFQTGAEAERAVFPLEYTGPTSLPKSPPCLPQKDACSPPLPTLLGKALSVPCSLTWTLLSDLLSNCYFVMSCVSLLKKRAESNLGAGSISIFIF